MGGQQHQQRRDLVFPPDSVEGVSPLLHKRRRLLARDVSPVDPWRLLMALKSGLLGESTWALDALAVLVCDDASVLWFGLSHLQGLLEVLMDHYRRCLNLVFSDLAGDTEVGCGSSSSDLKKRDIGEFSSGSCNMIYVRVNVPGTWVVLVLIHRGILYLRVEYNIF